MLIRTRVASAGNGTFYAYELQCGECGASVGRVSSDELRGLLYGRYPVLCHDCEGGADDVPLQLLPREGERVVVGDLSFGSIGDVYVVSGGTWGGAPCLSIGPLVNKFIEFLRGMEQRITKKN